jgi:DNA-binding transcriptional LysR family regulator
MLNAIDLSRIDLNLLVLFETVYAERHVGRSAERLNLTASAVSHGLRRLREVLNDPLFLRTPKGVTPTQRATELAEPVADALARVRSIVSSASPFDPAISTRRFTIGAPDAVSAVILPPLLDLLRKAAPGVAIGLKQVLAAQEEGAGSIHPWRSAYSDLDAGALHVAIVPSDDVPERFVKHHLYDEEFVIAMREGHPCAKRLTLDAYCAAQHLVVSENGDAYGFVDAALAQVGRTRRTVLTAPNFMFALVVLAQTELLCAIPRVFAERHAQTFGVRVAKPPVPLPAFRLNAVLPKPALMDAGLQWLLNLLQDAVSPPARRR